MGRSGPKHSKVGPLWGQSVTPVVLSPQPFRKSGEAGREVSTVRHKCRLKRERGRRHREGAVL